LLALGFSEKQIKLIVDLTRILLPSVGIMMLAGMVNGILNAYHRFSAAAYGPSLYNVLCAFSIIFLSRISIQAIAVGVLCSALLYFLFQLAFALRNMKYYKMVIDYRHEGSRRMFRLAVPSLMSSSIAQVNVFITSMFTTLYPSGSVVALNIADRIWQTPYGIFAQGMGIAMLPTLSEDYASDRLSEFKRILIKGLKTVMLLTAPSAAALTVLAKPLIEFFKFSAKFDAASMATAQSILIFFAIALLAHSVLTILIRAFYAVNDTKTPLFTGIIEILVNIGGAYLFYRFTNLGAGGMALSYSIAGVVNAVLLFYLMNKRVNGLGLKKFFVFSVKAIISAAVMSVVILFLNRILGFDSVILNYETALAGDIIKSKIFEGFALGMNALVGVVVYFGAMILMKAEEASEIFDKFKNKIKRMFARKI
jgi:putative peptidoglycan lipid II flippase